MSREYPILCSPFQPCAGNKPACTCPDKLHVQASVLALRQGSQWDPGLLPAFLMGFRAELEQGWEGGETALAWLHTAGSCREHAAAWHWQGLRNVSAGASVGPGLPVAVPSPSELCPAWLCPKKLVGLQCPCPICPAVLAAQWCVSLGRNCGGSVQDVSCPSPMNTSSWNCGMPGFREPLALLCFFPCCQKR